jgi:hypothetical protein
MSVYDRSLPRTDYERAVVRGINLDKDLTPFFVVTDSAGVGFAIQSSAQLGKLPKLVPRARLFGTGDPPAFIGRAMNPRGNVECAILEQKPGGDLFLSAVPVSEFDEAIQQELRRRFQRLMVWRWAFFQYGPFEQGSALLAWALTATFCDAPRFALGAIHIPIVIRTDKFLLIQNGPGQVTIAFGSPPSEQRCLAMGEAPDGRRTAGCDNVADWFAPVLLASRHLQLTSGRSA